MNDISLDDTMAIVKNSNTFYKLTICEPTFSIWNGEQSVLRKCYRSHKFRRSCASLSVHFLPWNRLRFMMQPLHASTALIQERFVFGKNISPIEFLNSDSSDFSNRKLQWNSGDSRFRTRSSPEITDYFIDCESFYESSYFFEYNFKKNGTKIGNCFTY